MTTMLKILIDNRNYHSWSIVNATNMEPIDIQVVPSEHKLFTNDIFTYKDNVIQIVHSSIRFIDNIAAVLILADGKTYGRNVKKNGDKGKRLYKCIPDDSRLPSFLVPYEIKQMGFSKVLTNLYVTVRFDNWEDKHPIGTLVQTIGSVDVLDNYYEYLLYSKSLNASIQKFTKDASSALKEKTSSHDEFIESICVEFPQIEDRRGREWQIFTIDPPKTTDFDDAYNVKIMENGDTMISVYISNVTIWMDVLNLWDSFSRRISTIYLPDRKRPMLPTVLSDCLCSLQQNVNRIAFVMDILLSKENGSIKEIAYKNCIIKVFKNFVYEETELLDNQHYTLLLEKVRQLSKMYRYITNVKNSHDIVCYMMIFMNYNTAKEFLKNKNGIFRSTLITKEMNIPNELPEDVTKFIKIWNSARGQYIDIEKLQDHQLEDLIQHKLLDMDAYIHITSPIRRLVDLLNILKFQENTGIICLSKKSMDFYNKWMSELDYINVTMRAIRKVQTDTQLLDTCFNNPSTIEKIYDGYCFDKLLRNDGLYQFIVYLPELKLVSKITVRDNLENFEKKQFKLYLFHDEEHFKKKIRLNLV
jgi:exoribonuclease R